MEIAGTFIVNMFRIQRSLWALVRMTFVMCEQLHVHTFTFAHCHFCWQTPCGLAGPASHWWSLCTLPGACCLHRGPGWISVVVMLPCALCL